LPALKEIFKPKLSSRNTIEIPQVPHQETTLLLRLLTTFPQARGNDRVRDSGIVAAWAEKFEYDRQLF
jgi:hypothetical protein